MLENYVLDKEQKEAVYAPINCPVLVLAGAGTGKTHTLMGRIMHLIDQGVYPRHILGITFTNKAAKDMKTKLYKTLPPELSSGVLISTFHSLGTMLLRRYGYCIEFGLTSDFSIFDKQDQKKVIKDVLTELGMAHMVVPDVAEKIDKWKNKGYGTDIVSTLPAQELFEQDGASNKRHSGKQSTESYDAGRDYIKIYQKYQDKLLEANGCDFGDLLVYAAKLLKNDEIRVACQKRWPCLLVDEYQDINDVQNQIIRSLYTKSLFCVGDEDQTIYTWRGAKVDNILKFEQSFSNAKVLKIQHNYRSAPGILKAANKLISNNKQRVGKFLIPTKFFPQSTGYKEVTVKPFGSDRFEAAFIARNCVELLKNNRSVAILARVNGQFAVLEEALIHIKCAYRVVGDISFYQKKVVKDFLAYLTLLFNINNRIALMRAIRVPKRGLGELTINKMFGKHSFADIMGNTELLLGSQKQRSVLTIFIQHLQSWKHTYDQGQKDLLDRIFRESGLYNHYLAIIDGREREKCIEDVKKLISICKSYEGPLETFLENVSLGSENDPTRDAASMMTNPTEKALNNHVQLMTLHTAKGLEFDHVFLCGWEDGLLPHARSQNNPEEAEEERRLAYVGITRAKRSCIISYAHQRLMHGHVNTSREPSPFIEELVA